MIATSVQVCLAGHFCPAPSIVVTALGHGPQEVPSCMDETWPGGLSEAEKVMGPHNLPCFLIARIRPSILGVNLGGNFDPCQGHYLLWSTRH